MPNRVGSPSPKVTTPKAPIGKTYKTVAGDTLESIAAKTKIAPEVLKKLNPSLVDANGNVVVTAGKTLKLPSGKTLDKKTAPEWAPKSNDKVLFVAVNNSYEHRSTDEADALKARGTNVQLIKDSDTPDKVTTVNAKGVKTEHDLTTAEGSLAFAQTLKLPPEQTQTIADVIRGGGPDAKDELAHIAEVWAQAERGGQPPSRLILSGHHVGGGVYGENNGKLDWPTVTKLAAAMPKGAKSVEDLMIAGCYSGGQSFMDKYQGIFPNVKTVVAYSGSSPGAASGATAHQKFWEKATRGTREDINRAIFDGSRKGENVVVWTKTHGYQDGRPPASLADLKSEVDRQRGAVDNALSGDEAITDPQNGPVRSYYNSLQRLIQHPETTPEERVKLEATRDQTIRLLFYPVVSKAFADAHSASIQAGFQSLGLPVPDFKTLNRKDALKVLGDFQTAFEAASPAPEAAINIASSLSAFKDLTPAAIPDTWI